MNKPKIRKVYKQVLALITIPFILTGCKKIDWDLTKRHVHKYVGSNNKGTIVNYFDSEYETVRDSYEDVYLHDFHYNRQDEYIEITKEDEEFYKVKNKRFYGPDNWNFLYNVMNSKRDYIEYEYTTTDGDDTFYHWHRDRNYRSNTGKVRIYHYRFCGHRFVYKNGKWIDERSPFVDDIRDIINEYPYFEIDCYKRVHKDYKVDKKKLANLKIEDINEFKQPDYANKELNINTK